eukprot:2719006-Alexandrium_andersonii.AAC.3
MGGDNSPRFADPTRLLLTLLQLSGWEAGVLLSRQPSPSDPSCHTCTFHFTALYEVGTCACTLSPRWAAGGRTGVALGWASSCRVRRRRHRHLSERGALPATGRIRVVS